MINKAALLSSYPSHNENRILTTNGQNDSNLPFVELKKTLSLEGISLITLDLVDDYRSLDLIIVLRHESNFSMLLDVIKVNRKIKILKITTEEVSVAPTQSNSLLNFGIFDSILTWRDNEIDNKLFFKYYYPNSNRFYNVGLKSKRKLVCLINAYKTNYFKSKYNIYSERFKVIEFFRSNDDFSLYGYNWDEYDSKLKNYFGSVRDKNEIFKKYDFAFIFENSNNEMGGISEKIWDAFSAGCIPIYYGAPNIADYIPSNCFICYKSFENIEKLHNHISLMTKKEKEKIRNQIEIFMNSSDYLKFTSKEFSKNILSHIKRLAKTKPINKSIFKIKINLLKNLFHGRISLLKHKRFYFNFFTSRYF